MRVYRVSLDNGKTYDLEVSPVHLYGGVKAAVTIVIYRVANGQRDPIPLRRVDGERLEFTASTEEAAYGLACGVLEWIHEAHVSDVSAALA